MKLLSVSVLVLASSGVLLAQKTTLPVAPVQPVQCSGEVCEECIEAAAAPIVIAPSWMGGVSQAAAKERERAAGETVAITATYKAGEILVETVLPDGTKVVDKMQAAAGAFAKEGGLNPEKAKELSNIIKQHENKVRAAGKRVSHLNLKGFVFSLGTLFVLAVEGSAAVGKYAADEVGAWVKLNNRGEDCSKLARWLAESAKACANECADCYAKRLATIPGAATATQCYADITAVTGKIFPEIEQQINARAQFVVGACGGKQGGWATVMNARPPIFDGLNVPSVDKVCPFK
jgi:hypothetical protein